MTMIRKEGAGRYQVGIYAVERVKGEHRLMRWTAHAVGPGTIGNGYVGGFPTLAAAYQQLTGEPLRARTRP